MENVKTVEGETIHQNERFIIVYMVSGTWIAHNEVFHSHQQAMEQVDAWRQEGDQHRVVRFRL